MEAIWMVLVTLVLVAAGVSVLALVAHVAARTRRRSPSPGVPGSLSEDLGERSAGAGAGEGGSVGHRGDTERMHRRTVPT